MSLDHEEPAALENVFGAIRYGVRDPRVGRVQVIVRAWERDDGGSVE